MTFSDFFDHLGDIDWLGVIVATVALMVFGFLWFGPLFGKTWAKGAGMPMDAGAKMPPAMLVATALYLFVFNIGIAYLAPLDDIEHSLVWGVVVGLLIIGASTYAGVVWRKLSRTVWFIETLGAALSVAIAIYVQGLFL